MEKWEKDDKPLLNHWYKVIGTHSLDYWKIQKDYYNERMQKTYWKIVEYYNSEIICSGKSLVYCRNMIKENTYKKGFI